MSDLPALGAFAVVTLLAAATGAMFMPGAWYAGLAKPSWTPPDWLFGPAWTVLYVMIAIAGWLIWRAQGPGLALALWGVQLVLNAAWSWLMFGRHDILAALVDVAALWLSIAALILAAWSVSQTAALLLLPYLAWVSFAAALNLAVWRLNA